MCYNISRISPSCKHPSYAHFWKNYPTLNGALCVHRSCVIFFVDFSDEYSSFFQIPVCNVLNEFVLCIP